jgi:predicted rRNA methylase YqxC with S4 and FtsJ domains
MSSLPSPGFLVGKRRADSRCPIHHVHDCVLEQRGAAIEVIDSPIHGMEGNHEYLLHARFV